MNKYLLIFLIAVVTSFLVTPLVERLARRFKVLDYPSRRKIHKTPVPLLGGLPIFVGFNAAILASFLFGGEYLPALVRTKWIPVLVSETIILFIGIYDDIKKVRVLQKFVFQIGAGLLVALFGFGLHSFKSPFSGSVVDLGAWGIPLTVLWVVGVTNALNLIDGLDGLASGITFIICFTIFGISFINQNVDIALLSLTLAGAVLGFLKYNFFPARIFLGDSGSLLLGFLLSVLSVEGAQRGAVVITVLAPILALGLPIMDTVLAMIRRVVGPLRADGAAAPRPKAKAPSRRRFAIFTADTDHIHHRLLKLGFSHRKAVVVLYGVCLATCALAFASIARQDLNVTVFLAAVVIALVIGVRSLRYQEFHVFRHTRILNLLDWPLIGKTYFQVFLDLLFIFLAYYFSTVTLIGTFSDAAVKRAFIQTFPVVLAIKIGILALTGLYAGTWKYTGIKDLVKITEGAFFSSAATYLALAIFPRPFAMPRTMFFVLDFYLLLTFVAGVRIAARGFDYYYREKGYEGECVLIYGGGRRGSLLVGELRRMRSRGLQIAGFIDDDPALQGKSLSGVAWRGAFEDLERLVREESISLIIITDDAILQKRKSELVSLCQNASVKLRLFEINIRPI